MRMRSRAPRYCLAALVMICLPSQARCDFQADSLALFGAWRWGWSAGGLSTESETSPPTGWCRVLYFRRDGTYTYWEQDSVGNYPLCSGKVATHQSRFGRVGGQLASLWVELAGWQSEERQYVAFVGRDTILTYPGSEDSLSRLVVSDALTNQFVREPNRPVPLPGDSLSGARVYPMRPPRLQGYGESYYAELSPELNQMLETAGPFHQWRDRTYPQWVRESFHYTNAQVPSAVIGDFDGDASPDIAIYGASEGWLESKVMCVLSNRGVPHVVTIMKEPTILDPPGTTVSQWRNPRPALYLSLPTSGEILKDADGRAHRLSSDAILVTHLGGQTTPYYYADGEFRKGRMQ